MDLGIDKENNLIENDSKNYEDYKEEDLEQIINIEELSISDTLNKINIDDCEGLFEDSLDSIPKKRKVSYNEKKYLILHMVLYLDNFIYLYIILI